MRTKNTELKDTWLTPEELLGMITRHSVIGLDPCAGEDTRIAEVNLRGETIDGLEASWGDYGNGIVFVNPPFTEKVEWLEKAVSEIANTKCIYFITPDSTDTKSWWHSYIAEYSDYTWFSKGRIDYVNPDTGMQESGATYGTCISIFGKPDPKVLSEMYLKGDLRKTVEMEEIMAMMKEQSPDSTAPETPRR